MPTLTKNSHTELSTSLASYLLSKREGDQLLSTRELAELYDASLGSVSAATRHLEQIGAVVISRRGRLGAFLKKKDLGVLWSIIENGPLVVALTLPSFPKCEGLATAIYSLLNKASLPTYLIFIRGSLNRIEALRHGQCHVAVMSVLAADELCGPNEGTILKLPPKSYVDEHRVFFRQGSKTASRPLTVGYDPDSFDVEYLTKLEFGDDTVNFQPITFTQIDLHLEETSLDAAITNGDFSERLEHKGFYARPISPRVQALVGDRHTAAALVVPTDAVATKTVLKEILDPAKIIEIQQQVVQGQIVPRY